MNSRHQAIAAYSSGIFAIEKIVSQRDAALAALREIAEDPRTHEASPIGERYERLLAAARAALAGA